LDIVHLPISCLIDAGLISLWGKGMAPTTGLDIAPLGQSF
jgi:hypothetical protein